MSTRVNARIRNNKVTSLRVMSGELPRSTRILLSVTRRNDQLTINGWRLAVPSAHLPKSNICIAQRTLEKKITVTAQPEAANRLLHDKNFEFADEGEKTTYVNIGLLSEHMGLAYKGSLDREFEGIISGQKTARSRILFSGEKSAILPVLRSTKELRTQLADVVMGSIEAFFKEGDVAYRRKQNESLSRMKPLIDSKNELESLHDAAYFQGEVIRTMIRLNEKEADSLKPKFIFPKRLQELMVRRIQEMEGLQYQGITDTTSRSSGFLRDKNKLFVDNWESFSKALNPALEKACLGDEQAIIEANKHLIKVGLRLIKVNDQVRLVLSGKLIIISGPSGSGKGKCQEVLIEQGVVKYIIGTSRKPRPGEGHGKEYFFLTEEEAKKLADSGDNISSAVVHGDIQVVPKGIIEVAEQGLTAFVEVDTQHAINIKKYLEDQGDFVEAHFVFMRTQNGEEQERRLFGRRTETKEKAKLRLTDAAKEIIGSARAHEIVIENDDIYAASQELLSRVGLLDSNGQLIPRDAASVEENNGGRQYPGMANGLVTVNSYNEMAARMMVPTVGSYNIRGTVVPTEASEINAQELAAFREFLKYVYLGRDGREKPRVPSPLTFKNVLEAAQMVADRFPHWVGKASGVRIGLHPGTMNPPTFGHISASIASVVGNGLDAVIEMPGGDIPDKPLAPSFPHRLEMLKRALMQDVTCVIGGEKKTIFNPYSLPSNIRQLMVDTLTDEFLGKPEFFAANAADRRAMRDIAAFTLLRKLNPNAHFTYLIGGDKVVDYAKASKNEYPLIAALKELGINIVYFDRGGQSVQWEDLAHCKWLHELGPDGIGMIRPSNIPSFDISATELRRRVAMQLPITDIVPVSVAEYIFGSEHPLYKLYGLEHRISEMNKSLKEAKEKKDQARIDKIEQEDKPAIIAEVQNLKDLKVLPANADVTKTFSKGD